MICNPLELYQTGYGYLMMVVLLPFGQWDLRMMISLTGEQGTIILMEPNGEMNPQQELKMIDVAGLQLQPGVRMVKLLFLIPVF